MITIMIMGMDIVTAATAMVATVMDTDMDTTTDTATTTATTMATATEKIKS